MNLIFEYLFTIKPCFFSPNWGLWWQWQKCWPNINKSTLRWFQILPLWIHMPCRTCKYLQSNFFFFKLWIIVLIFLTWCSIIMIFLFDPITLVMTKILTHLLWWLLNNNNCFFYIHFSIPNRPTIYTYLLRIQ